MDRRSRLYKRKSGSCFTLRNNEIVEEEENVSNYSDSSYNSQQASDYDIALEVHIAESLQRLLRSSNVKFTTTGCSKHRKKLLEQCKLKLMATCSCESMEVNRHPQRKQEDKRAVLRKDERCVNSAPLNACNQPPETSNTQSRSVDTVNHNGHRHCNRHKHDKREMGDQWLSEKPSETSSAKIRRLKRKLMNKRDIDIGDNLRQVYATARTSNLKELLKCQNPNRHKEDPKTPCFCQNCGIIDVLLESQKRPYTEETYACEEPENSNHNNRSFRSRTEILKPPADCMVKEENKQALNELRERMKVIETTLQEQAEKYVTKEYLRLVVDKLVSYFAPKSERHKTPVVKKDTSTQCKKPIRLKDTATLKVDPIKRKQNDRIVGSAFSFETSPQPSSLFAKSNKEEDIFWKWGNETIKPGLDLKSKILRLIQEIIKPEKKIDVCIKTSSEKTLYLYGSENQAGTSSLQKNSTNSVKSGGNVKKMLDFMSEKIYSDYVNNNDKIAQVKIQKSPKRIITDETFKQNMQEFKKKTGLLKSENETTQQISQKPIKRSLIPKYKKNDTDNDGRIQVTYMSPKANMWKASCMCFKVEEHFKKYIENGYNGPINSTGKYICCFSTVRKHFFDVGRILLIL